MVLNFWTTTCGPCISEMPDLAEFEQALPDNVRFATICLDAQGNEDAVRTILNEAGYEGLTLTSGDGDYASVCGKVQATPTTVLVLPDGTFVGDIVLGTQEVSAARCSKRSTRRSRMPERRRSLLMSKSRTLFLVRLVLLALACSLIAIGLSQGEALMVLQKAVKICLECIGIG